MMMTTRMIKISNAPAIPTMIGSGIIPLLGVASVFLGAAADKISFKEI